VNGIAQDHRGIVLHHAEAREEITRALDDRGRRARWGAAVSRWTFVERPFRGPSGRLTFNQKEACMRNLIFGSMIVVCACRAPHERPAKIGDDAMLTRGALANERPPIIDMHHHAALPPHAVAPGAPALCRPEPCTGEGGATVDHQETRKKTLAAMDRYNIVRAFLSGVDPAIVQEWVAAAPGRFIAAPFILRPGQPPAEALRRDLAAGRLAGVGEIATQLSGIAPNDPALEPYFALAEERDVPVLIHTLGIGPYLPSFRVGAGNPVLLEDVLVRHPKLRLFVENAGYPYRGEMIAMMTQYPRLHADVSTITWVIPRAAFYDHLEALVRAGLGKRLMFGSDQMRWPDKIGEGIEAIEKAPFLTPEQKRDILYHNAARFLRMEPERE
jgi:predicted TIM-barrel fold metal-dependent hydrolase